MSEITSVYQLNKFKGKTIYLVTTVLAKFELGTAICDTFITPWRVSELFDAKGEPYSGRQRLAPKRPWFCFCYGYKKEDPNPFEDPKYAMISVGDYIGPRNKMFSTEQSALAYQMKIKLREPATKLKKVEVKGLVFEGTTISMRDFFRGDIPGFRKETWERM